jgi:hypothetical protein
MRQEAGTLQAGRGYATDRIGTALDLVQQVAQAMAARIDMGVGVGQEHLLGGGVPQAMHQRAALAGVGLVRPRGAGPARLQRIKYLGGVVGGTVVHADHPCHVGVLQQAGQRALQARRFVVGRHDRIDAVQARAGATRGLHAHAPG